MTTLYLTNYSINKHSSGFVAGKVNSMTGSKWSLFCFLRHLRDGGISEHYVMEQVKDVVVKTVLAGEAGMFQASS